MTWTTEERSRAIAMQDAGASFSAIALALDKTRGAVSGLFFRLQNERAPSILPRLEPRRPSRAKKRRGTHAACDYFEPWAVFHARKVAERAALRIQQKDDPA